MGNSCPQCPSDKTCPPEKICPLDPSCPAGEIYNAQTKMCNRVTNWNICSVGGNNILTNEPCADTIPLVCPDGNRPVDGKCVCEQQTPTCSSSAGVPKEDGLCYKMAMADFLTKQCQTGYEPIDFLPGFCLDKNGTQPTQCQDGWSLVNNKCVKNGCTETTPKCANGYELLVGDNTLCKKTISNVATQVFPGGEPICLTGYKFNAKTGKCE